MAKLILDCEENLNFENLLNAVYKTLNQEDNLMAELVFISASEMQELNKNARGVDKVTDVLSFPTLDNVRGKVLYRKDFPNDVDGENLMIGSIVMCLDKIKEQAEELGHSQERERDYLLVHGLMHLFGYDHLCEQDKKQMRDKEKQALSLLGIEQ